MKVSFNFLGRHVAFSPRFCVGHDDGLLLGTGLPGSSNCADVIVGTNRARGSNISLAVGATGVMSGSFA